MIALSASKKLFCANIPVNIKVVIAVSGGPDSMCLLDLCSRLLSNHQIIVAHFDHGIRQESRRDALFVQQFCRKNKLVYITAKEPIPILAKKQKRSLEETARKYRYAFLEKVRLEYHAAYILTAHHKDDNVETILLHIIRGSGLHGMTGMREISGYLFRPLLSYTKNEILTYCKAHRVPYRIDRTNNLANISRNILRLQVIPLLQKINPNFTKTLVTNAEQYQELEAYIMHNVKKICPLPRTATLLKKGWAIQRIMFQQAPVALQRSMLQVWYSAFHGSTQWLTFHHVETIRRFIVTGGTGKSMRLGKKCIIELRYKELVIRPPHNAVPSEKRKKLRLNGSTRFHHFTIHTAITDRPTAPLYCIAYDRLRPLYVRSWKSGDSFSPLGMKGRKKLQDFFTDHKIPQRERNVIPLIVDEKDRIVAVYNLRIDDTVKITSNTKKILTFSFHPA